jgi:hypothetical protein
MDERKFTIIGLFIFIRMNTKILKQHWNNKTVIANKPIKYTKWNYKKYSSNPKEHSKREKGTQKDRTNKINSKLVDSRPITSVITVCVVERQWSPD